MRNPAFWENPPDAPGWQAYALAPLAVLYGAGTARRVRASGWQASVPVISVGNINVGGTGKTPTVIMLADRLSGSGQKPHVVSRGYGGRLAGPVRVDGATHSAADVGDEPLLLSAFLPAWVSRNRASGVMAAEAAGATVVLLDDAHQNPTVKKDLSVVVVDAEAGFGNARVMPAGPLREPVEIGLARADLVLSIGDVEAQERFANRWGTWISCALATGSMVPLQTGMEWAGLRTFAFAGIGRPEKFFKTLRRLGADLVRAQALSDHQPLTPALMKRLEIEAEMARAQLVTTEKDAVRLPASFRQKVLTLPVRLRLDESAELDSWLARVFT